MTRELHDCPWRAEFMFDKAQAQIEIRDEIGARSTLQQLMADFETDEDGTTQGWVSQAKGMLQQLETTK